MSGIDTIRERYSRYRPGMTVGAAIADIRTLLAEIDTSDRDIAQLVGQRDEATVAADDLTSVIERLSGQNFGGHSNAENDPWRHAVETGTRLDSAAKIRADVAREIAEDIVAELVCCRVYDEQNGVAAEDQPHPMCFWASAAARIATEHDAEPDSRGHRRGYRCQTCGVCYMCATCECPDGEENGE